MSALIEACREGDSVEANRLLSMPGVDVNAKDGQGLTALHWAVGKGDAELVSGLLAAPGIDVNVQALGFVTALHWATLSGQVKVVSSLLEFSGIEVGVRDHQGFTALHRAAQQGRVEVVSCFLATPGLVDVNIGDTFGDTALHWAAASGHTGVVSRLLAAPGIKVDVQDDRGWTALHYAAGRGDSGMVWCFLEVEADPKVQNKKRKTPWDKANQRGYVKTAQLIEAAIRQKMRTDWMKACAAAAGGVAEVRPADHSGAAGEPKAKIRSGERPTSALTFLEVMLGDGIRMSINPSAALGEGSSASSSHLIVSEYAGMVALFL